MKVDKSGAIAGQWILLAISLVLLLVTILLVFKYRKAKKYKKSASLMELKWTGLDVAEVRPKLL